MYILYVHNVHINILYNVPITTSLELAVPDFFMPLHLAALQNKDTFLQKVNFKGGIQHKDLNLQNIYVADKARKQILALPLLPP